MELSDVGKDMEGEGLDIDNVVRKLILNGIGAYPSPDTWIVLQVSTLPGVKTFSENWFQLSYQPQVRNQKKGRIIVQETTGPWT